MGRIYPLRKSEMDAIFMAAGKDISIGTKEEVDASVLYNQQIKTGDRFLDPETLYSDWHNELLEYKPGVNFTFEMVHDWFNRPDPGIFFRGQQTPIDWKSKIGNSDMSTNLKVERSLEIYKGDYVIREDGKIFLCNWNITNHANNLGTQSTECNGMFTFKRRAKMETDDEGMRIHRPDIVVDRRGYEVIVDSIPVNWTLYQGRPDRSVIESQPGITPQDLVTISLQWNEKTKEIMLDDEVQIRRFTYRIDDVVTSEIDMYDRHGVLVLNARRVPGGVVQDG